MDKTSLIITLLVATTLFVSYAEAAEETKKKQSKVLSLETTIVVTKEQPKLLSIVPWHSKSFTKLEQGKLTFVLGGEFSHIEPNELKTQLALYRQLMQSKK